MHFATLPVATATRLSRSLCTLMTCSCSRCQCGAFQFNSDVPLSLSFSFSPKSSPRSSSVELGLEVAPNVDGSPTGSWISRTANVKSLIDYSQHWLLLLIFCLAWPWLGVWALFGWIKQQASSWESFYGCIRRRQSIKIHFCFYNARRSALMSVHTRWSTSS